MSQPVMRLSDYESDARYEATVVSSERITAADAVEVRDLVLQVARTDVTYRVGQSIGVYAPGAAAFGHRPHFRLYSIADLPGAGPDGHPRLTICVRRCSYVDPYSGEEYPGVASHYLCDRRPGDTLTIAPSIVTSNGTIHVIDAVPLPPAATSPHAASTSRAAFSTPVASRPWTRTSSG